MMMIVTATAIYCGRLDAVYFQQRTAQLTSITSEHLGGPMVNMIIVVSLLLMKHLAICALSTPVL